MSENPTFTLSNLHHLPFQTVCHPTTTFTAHFVNQGVAHVLYAPQIVVLFLERPTDNTIEIAVGFVREVGAFLQENSTKANAMAFIRFRSVLNECGYQSLHPVNDQTIHASAQVRAQSNTTRGTRPCRRREASHA